MGNCFGCEEEHVRSHLARERYHGHGQYHVIRPRDTIPIIYPQQVSYQSSYRPPPYNPEYYPKY